MAHILLVEPDRLIAKTYMQVLQSAGHSVQVCATAQSAVFCADEQPPDLLILELQLVGHSGIELLYELRSYLDWQELPVVIVTNVPAGEFQGSWQLLRDELGVQAYHYKPLFSLTALREMVGEYALA
jgi:DNA-binding response OmpR family regulator